MGAVFRPKDLPSGRKKIIENAVKDFGPDVKNDVIKLLETWELEKLQDMFKESLTFD
jgi:hypothetical protein